MHEGATMAMVDVMQANKQPQKLNAEVATQLEKMAVL